MERGCIRPRVNFKQQVASFHEGIVFDGKRAEFSINLRRDLNKVGADAGVVGARMIVGDQYGGKQRGRRAEEGGLPEQTAAALLLTPVCSLVQRASTSKKAAATCRPQISTTNAR